MLDFLIRQVSVFLFIYSNSKIVFEIGFPEFNINYIKFI